MKKEIDIYKYDQKKGVFDDEIDGHEFISFKIEKNKIIIQANEQGFIKLGRLFLSFAYNEIPNGRHIHLDDEKMSGILSDNSASISIYKRNDKEENQVP